jgi:hypothetical protein
MIIVKFPSVPFIEEITGAVIGPDKRPVRCIKILKLIMDSIAVTSRIVYGPDLYVKRKKEGKRLDVYTEAALTSGSLVLIFLRCENSKIFYLHWIKKNFEAILRGKQYDTPPFFKHY